MSAAGGAPLRVTIWVTAEILLLAAVSLATPLGALAWGAGVGGALASCLLFARALRESGASAPTVADRITLARALLGMAVTALVVESLRGPVSAPVLVALAAAALALDAADGRSARRRGEVTALGARFDMEVDAWLILVLSVHAASRVGAWVLAIGLARYALLAAAQILPWLRADMPVRYWNKVVAALQGIVLVVAAANVLPRPALAALLVVAAALLAESFADQVAWLWAHRRGAGVAAGSSGRPPARTAPTLTGTLAAGVIVWAALAAPNMAQLFVPSAFLVLPVAWIGIAALACALPSRARRPAALALGTALGLLVLVKALDVGFFAAFDRPVDLATDASYAGPGIGVLIDTLGRPLALAAVAGVALAAVATVVLLAWATARLMGGIAAWRRGVAWRATGALATLWLVLAVTGAVTPELHWNVASQGSLVLARARLAAIPRTLADGRRFARDIAADPWRAAPAGSLLAGLAGRDVLLVFVESYGRVAVSGAPFAADVDAALQAATQTLAAHGFEARSAFLISPTFGGGSWLAHATLEAGLWVDSQHRYGQLLRSGRLTLAGAFSGAGWRTVSVAPADTRPWPEGRAFYRWAQLYNARNLGYAGPRLGYSTMPDQYALAAFQRLELDATARTPVFAEIDLTSSHAPWTPLPRLLPWTQVGDGRVYATVAGLAAGAGDGGPDAVRARYAQSIRYTLDALTSFLVTRPDPNRVVIVLGDHQPWAAVSGSSAGHAVPVAIIARDAAVLRRIAGWRWDRGLRPAATAPAWRMDAFRDRFFAAFSAAGLAEGGQPAPR